MAVPKFNEFFPSIIRCLHDGTVHSSKEILAYCIAEMHLTEEDCQAQYETSKVLIVNDRVSWAQTFLKKAGLIASPSKGKFVIKEDGKKAFAKGADCVTLKYLEQFPSYLEFKKRKKDDVIIDPPVEPKSPQESIEDAIDQLNSSLADQLMDKVLEMDPYSFENLVVKLLIKMGYGSSDLSKNRVTKKAGDDGVDGFVTADRFGFDTIYTQAKQWKPDSTIGQPDIQQFLGALAGQGASKGIFITTAKFSTHAKEFVSKTMTHKIVLVDGQMLMKLMIEYDLGVSTVATYAIKRIDSDFFTDE